MRRALSGFMLYGDTKRGRAGRMPAPMTLRLTVTTPSGHSRACGDRTGRARLLTTL